MTQVAQFINTEVAGFKALVSEFKADTAAEYHAIAAELEDIAAAVKAKAEQIEAAVEAPVADYDSYTPAPPPVDPPPTPA